MTKAKISEYSATAGDNTDVNGVNIAEGCPPSSMNNMGREIMAALKRYQVGSDGDGITVGGNFVVSGSTTLSTALPVASGGTGITSFGTGVATFLGTPSSSNLAAAVTDETGTGALVFATSPALGGIVTTASGNLRIDPATQIVEVLGDGASIVGQIQLNCHVNSHGQKIASQPHSQAASNTLTLPGGTTIGDTNATLVSDIGTQTLTNKTLGATTLSGALSCADQVVNRAVLEDYAIQGSAVGNTGATRTLDLSVANFFSATLDQACTFTFSNPPASGDFGTFVLELTNGGAFAITYPASVDFVGGVAPTLTASGKDQLVFTTRDAGTTYFAFVAGLDIKSP